MKKELSLNKKIIVGVLLLTTVLIISFTYALFTKTLTSNKSISIKSGSKYVGIYGENKNNIELNNTYTFTIENRGIVDSGYEVYLVDEESNTIDLSKVTYTVNNQTVKTGLLSEEKTDRVITSGILKTNETKTITVNLTTSASGTYKGRLKIVSTDYFEKEDFDYTGDSQIFTVPTTGTYKIELWGAQGGDKNTNDGGTGAYTIGNIYFKKEKSIDVVVGSKGKYILNNQAGNDGGYNGGGDSFYISQEGTGGGGATDIRLNASLNSRIMVAAGGGGGGYEFLATGECANGLGGVGGALNGIGGICTFSPWNIDTWNYNGYGATQISGGITLDGNSKQINSYGSFGKGGHGDSVGCCGGSGGGGGYYGGGGSTRGHNGAGGGSSYISGYTGCVAITSETDISPKQGCLDGTTDINCSYHYSGYKFDNANMLDGKSEIPSHDGLTTMTGNSGNGYAKITFIGQ